MEINDRVYGIKIIILNANAFPAYFHAMNNSSFCILCLSSDTLRQQLFIILKVNMNMFFPQQ